MAYYLTACITSLSAFLGLAFSIYAIRSLSLIHICTEGGWVKILLPEREGYVCGDYLTISDTSTGDGSFSLSLGEDELSSLMGLLGGGGGSALTPDGNLTLVDDYGSTTGTGKQFITLETKAGNVFYLIIDRDDKGEETCLLYTSRCV